MDERLQKQLNFILEIDKEKNIFRQTHLSGHGRRENDAEHAWHMAVMAYLLQEYSNEPVDVARVMLMCLLHDVVEIDAGDTYAYDTDGLQTQKTREDAAKQRIYSLLPDDQKRELMAVFDEFEADETAEAHFAHAMDNLQPLLLNNSNGGSDWADHDVTAKQVYGRQSRTEKGSAYLYELTDKILQANIEKGALKEKYKKIGIVFDRVDQSWSIFAAERRMGAGTYAKQGGENVSAEIIIAGLSLLGTLAGTAGGIIVSGKLVNYRIEQLEKKVEKHNNLITRTFRLEQQVALLDERVRVANHRISDLEKEEVE